MKTRKDIECLEKTLGQLTAIHREMSLLSKKSPNDAVNKFKLGRINQALEAANNVLGSRYTPVEGFKKFEEDDAPSNSDVVFVLAQYLEEVQRYKADNTVIHNFKNVYVLNGKPSNVLT
ncbi:MAG: hypothetical protein OXC42_03415 [Gammaproteobacteria bacterium]|nr:hypothetical protein [Gammaproteobacteria bacterium]